MKPSTFDVPFRGCGRGGCDPTDPGGRGMPDGGKA
jgi:hypothetical protein